jgi:hypothetical protein
VDVAPIIKTIVYLEADYIKGRLNSSPHQFRPVRPTPIPACRSMHTHSEGRPCCGLLIIVYLCPWPPLGVCFSSSTEEADRTYEYVFPVATYSVYLILQNQFSSDGIVKLAAQFLQCVADISSAPHDSLLSPALLIILYSICFLLLIVEMWFGRHEMHQQEERVLDRP